MKRSSDHIGRLRLRAAKILNQNFPDWDVNPEDIQPATGRHRSDWRLDTYRWELFSQTKTGLPVVCGSWDTLTRFVGLAAKNGCGLHGGEIYAKES